MGYIWKFIRLMANLFLLLLGATIIINGSIILLNLVHSLNVQPFFDYYLPVDRAVPFVQSTLSLHTVDNYFLSNFLFAALCLIVGLLLFIRSVHHLVSGIEFFASDFYVGKRSKAKPSTDEIMYEELMTRSIPPITEKHKPKTTPAHHAKETKPHLKPKPAAKETPLPKPSHSFFHLRSSPHQPDEPKKPVVHIEPKPSFPPLGPTPEEIAHKKALSQARRAEMRQQVNKKTKRLVSSFNYYKALYMPEWPWTNHPTEQNKDKSSTFHLDD